MLDIATSMFIPCAQSSQNSLENNKKNTRPKKENKNTKIWVPKYASSLCFRCKSHASYHLAHTHTLWWGKKVHYFKLHSARVLAFWPWTAQSDEKKELTPIKLRKKAADFAKQTVEKQKTSFKRYGNVWALLYDCSREVVCTIALRFKLCTVCTHTYTYEQIRT